MDSQARRNGRSALFLAGTLCRDQVARSLCDQVDRITRDPEVMGGNRVFGGCASLFVMIVGQIGAGHTIEELLADYPYLERKVVLQALRYAAWLAEEREVSLPHA